MDPMFQDERISAYLDGELPPDERSQFEQELARNGELRLVVEELRSLHDSLQGLPRHRLSDDFAEQVLRRAERTMLSDSQAVANGADRSVVEDSRVVRNPVADADSETRGSRRPWIWAAVVIAAAIALMVFNPPPKKHVDVAQNDETVQPNGRDQNRAEGLLPKGEIAGAPADGEPQLRKRSEVESGKVKLRARFDSDVADQTRLNRETKPTVETTNGTQTLPSGTTLGATPPSRRGLDRGIAEKKTDDARDGHRLAKPGEVQFRRNGEPLAGAPTKAPPETPAASTPAPIAPAPIAPAGRPSSFAGGSDHLPPGKTLPVEAKKPAEPARGPATNDVASRGSRAAARSFAYRHEQKAGDKLPSGVILVAEIGTTAEVSPESLQRLLDKRGIALNNSPASNLALLGAVHSAADGNGSLGSTPPYNAPAADSFGDGSGNSGHGGKDSNATGLREPAPASRPQPVYADGAAPNPAADEEPLDVVYVVGTRDQVMGLVNDFREQPAQFRTVSLAAITPAASERRDEDSKAGNNVSVSKDKSAKVAADISGGGREGRFGVLDAKPQVAAPAPPQTPPAEAAGATVKVSDKPAPVQSEKLAARPGTESAPAGRGNGGFVRPLAKDELPKSEPAKSEPARLEPAKPEPVKSETAKLPAAIKPGASGGAGVSRSVAPMVADPNVKEKQPRQKETPPAVQSPKLADHETAADHDDAAEPEALSDLVEQPNGWAWAARMTHLPPDDETGLRRSLAERGKELGNAGRGLDLQQRKPAAGGSTELQRDNKAADKTKAEDQLKEQIAKRDKAARPEGTAAASEQVQAILVFRRLPKKPIPTEAAPAPALPASAPAKTK